MNSSQRSELTKLYEQAELENQKTELVKQEAALPADAAIEDVGFPQFPNEALIGPLKEIIEACPLPPQFMYLTLVTMFGSLVGPRLLTGIMSNQLSGRLYGVLLAPAGGNKGTTLNLCKYLLAIPASQQDEDDDHPTSGVQVSKDVIRKGDGIGSGESLIAALKADGGHACLYWHEMSAFFNKGHIEGSTLFGNVADLYYETLASARRSGGKGSAPSVVVTDAWLSLIGGLTRDAWESAWNKQMGTGLFRRFQLAAVEKAERVPRPDDEKLFALAEPLRHELQNPRIPEWRMEADLAWESWSGQLPLGEAFVSIDENVKRVALILACMCCTDVTEEVMSAAIAWGDYQFKLREMLAPSSTDNKEALCEEYILKHLPKLGKVTWKWLYRKATLSRFGSGMAQRVRGAIVSNGLMAYAKPFVWRTDAGAESADAGAELHSMSHLTKELGMNSMGADTLPAASHGNGE